MPLWMTCTRSASMAGYTRRTSSRIAPDTATTASPLEARPLAEARERVPPVAQLLALPRPFRLEAVRRRDVGDIVQQLREMAGEIGVPGVTVDEVGSRRGSHQQVDGDGLESRVRVGQCGPRLVGVGAVAWRAEAAYLDVDQALELPHEVLDMDAGAAVDVRRILACHHGCPHRGILPQAGSRRAAARRARSESVRSATLRGRRSMRG